MKLHYSCQCFIQFHFVYSLVFPLVIFRFTHCKTYVNHFELNQIEIQFFVHSMAMVECSPLFFCFVFFVFFFFGVVLFLFLFFWMSFRFENLIFWRFWWNIQCIPKISFNPCKLVLCVHLICCDCSMFPHWAFTFTSWNQITIQIRDFRWSN